MARRRNDLLIDVRTPHREKLREALRDLGISKKKADAILEAYPDGRGLAVAGAQTLESIGLKPAEARRVVAAFQVAQACDSSCRARAQHWPMRDPQGAAQAFRQAAGRQDREIFMVAFLDARQTVIDMMGVAIGSLSDVSVHPREIFKEAMRRNAHAIILAHNHPSGSPEASKADIALTRRMVEAGELTGIPVLDHVIVTPDDALSFASVGLMRAPSRGANPRALRRSLTRHA